jgi:sorbitol/mannitol transport system substrate-binding protein
MKFSSKRVWIFGLILALLCSVPLVEAAPKVTTIKIVSQKGNPIFEANLSLIPEFEKANPGIKVEVVDIPSSVILEKMMSSLAVESPEYDVLFVNDDWMPLFARRPYLVPLDTNPLFKDDLKDMHPIVSEVSTYPHAKYMLPKSKQNSKQKPHFWAMPFMFGTVVMFYRTDLIKTPPTNQEEFIKVAKDVTTENMWGFVTMLKPTELGIAYLPMPVTLSNGGSFFDTKWKPTVNSESVRKSIQFVDDLMNKHKVSPPGMPTYGRTEARALFMDGKAAMIQEESYIYSTLTDKTQSKVWDKVGVAIQPYWAAGPIKRRYITGGTWNWGINVYSNHKNEAARLVKFLTSPAANTRLFEMTGTSVPRLSVARELSAKSDLYKILAKSIDEYGYIWTPQRMYNIPEWPELAYKLETHFVDYWTRKKNLNDALTEADKEAHEILQRAGYYR